MRPESDPALSRLYRNAARAEPPARLDERILAAARGDDVPAADPARPPRLPRWQVPLALAAVLTLAVSLTLVVDEELERVPTVADLHRQPTVASKPMELSAAEIDAAGNAASAQESEAAAAVQARTLAETQRFRDGASPQAAPPDRAEAAAAEARSDLDRQRLRMAPDVAPPMIERLAQDPGAAPSSPQLPQAALPSAPAPAMREPPPAARTAADGETRPPATNEAVVPRVKAAKRAEAETAPHAGAEQPMRAEEKVRMRAVPEQRPNAALAPPPAQPEPSGAGKLERSPARADSPGESQAGASAPAGVEGRHPSMRRSAAIRADSEPREARTPEQWLRDIEQLRNEGRDEEVRSELEAFRARFPEHPLPPGLR